MDEALLIKHTIVHTLNNLVIELLREAYQLAMLDELKSLDGLIDTRLDKWMRSDDAQLIVLDDDLDVLATVEDPAIKVVLESIYTILNYNKTFQILQDIDLDLALADDEASSEAANVLSTYIVELSNGSTYEDFKYNIVMCYTSVGIILYHCIMQLDLGTTEVWEEGMDSWLSPLNNHGFDYQPKNSSGELLLELKDALMSDSVRFDGIGKI